MHTQRAVHLAATRGSRRRMRLTDFCFPTTRLRALASRRFPFGRPTFTERLEEDSAFHDAVIRFGGSLPIHCGAEERSLLLRCLRDLTSDTLVASPVDAHGAFARMSLRGPPRSLSPSPREEEQRSRPRVPSTVR